MRITILSCALINAIPSGEAGNIEVVANDDKTMNAAIQEARDTLPLFIAALQSPSPGQTGFSIKAKFPYGNDDSAEHMWLSGLSYNGSVFEGKLDNEPIYIDGLHQGEVVSVSEANVTDWIIIDDGILLGGFTIHVIRDGMTEKDRQQFDQDMGIMIGDAPELP